MAARLMLSALAALLAMPLAAASLPDPTALPVFQAGQGGGDSPEAAVLAWVSVNGNHSIAWYDGTTVKVGDSVEGGRVAAIHEDHIVLSGKDGRRAVYLLDHAIRTQPQAQPRPVRNNRN
ncbi:MAG: hypothetical protein KKE84_06680 [Gammaproteobacteria bacterium]|nr:hypothetical protein [Gammaproteobacteria bacterium]